ncbi:MAG TPA: ATP-binding protein [Gammaproteobacteria bacterium]|nr:ATP-binding protein [Gammaproteobacteria bacterium]
MKFRFAATPMDSIRTLFWWRNVAIVGQLIAVWVAYRGLHVTLPLTPLLAAIFALFCFNVFTALRLRGAWHATHLEVTLQFAVDMAVLGVLLYFSGGATNPFASLYLIPVSLAAVALPLAYAWCVALAAILAYSFLMLHFVPLDYTGESMSGIFNLHVGGMWINFILSTLLISAFLVPMARIVKRRDRELAGMRETVLRNEHINAIGTLAAGAAHELSTPLSTMAILVSELETDHVHDAELCGDLGLMAAQIRVCKDRLNDLLELSGHPRGQTPRTSGLKLFLEGVFDHWRLVRPAVSIEIEWRQPFVDCRIIADQGLAQTLMNLLNNAADATLDNGHSRVALSIGSDGCNLHVYIDDEGRGLCDAAAIRPGEMFFTSKQQGWGLGLALSNANLDRLHGSITLLPRNSAGLRTEVRLPLAALAPGARRNEDTQA